MAFDKPAPELAKIVAAWEGWEEGEGTPGRVRADMKTAGLPEVPQQLTDSGWTARS